jgi:hypothetical protein
MQRRAPIVSRTTPSSLSQGSPYVVIRDAAPSLSQHCGSDGLSAARVESGSQGVGDHAASRSRSGRGGALLPRASRRLHSPGSAEAFMPACALPWSATVGEQRQRDRVLAEPRKRRGSANGCGRSTRRPRSAKQQSSAATPRRNHPKRNRHERRERTTALPERQSPAGGRAGRVQWRLRRRAPRQCGTSSSPRGCRTNLAHRILFVARA